MKRVVITGATGMIGQAVIRKMIKENVEVLVLARPDSPRLQTLPKHDLIHVETCGLQSISQVKSDLKYDAFFHLAWVGTTGEARDDMDLQIQNIRGAIEAVKLAEKLGCDVFVGAGSQAEYGRVADGTKLSPDTPCFPETGYGMAKLCAGQMTRRIARKAGMRHVWMRILSVYGPYDGNSMVMSGIRKLAAGECPQYTKGEQMWDYLYCDDAAEALFLAAVNAPEEAVYCLGSGNVRPLSEYITIIRDTVAPGAPIGLGEIEYFPNQVMYLCADIGKLTKDTGFTPKIAFEEGIRETYSWFQKTKEQENFPL